MPTLKQNIIVVAAVSLLLGCASEDMGDLEAKINQIKAKPAGFIKPVPEFKSYESFAYGGEALRDPFSSELKVESERVDEPFDENALPPIGPSPDKSRHKESLEVFPLDTIRYVGLLDRGEERWAIVVSPDQLIHKVKVDNYIGTNHGHITNITESSIELTELVANGVGGWIERHAALSLGE